MHPDFGKTKALKSLPALCHGKGGQEAEGSRAPQRSVVWAEAAWSCLLLSPSALIPGILL